mgnify:CR=1 FL=1
MQSGYPDCEPLSVKTLISTLNGKTPKGGEGQLRKTLCYYMYIHIPVRTDIGWMKEIFSTSLISMNKALSCLE